MAWLKWWGYNVISLADAYAGLYEGKQIPEKAIVLTFDDGCDNFREYAWPILKKYHYPVTVFLVAGLLGQTTRWMDDVPEHASLMDAQTIRSLRKEGVGFGAHSINHVRLSECPPEVAREEIFGSKARLEDLLGEVIPDFCYPYGNYNERIVDMAAEAGFKTGLTCIRAAANYARSPLELPRKAISYGDTLPGYFWKIHMKNRPKNPDRAGNKG
ncbi:MAG: polysaccharide deacetylase family protein [Betaproteobacteria bacterium]|nr:polysaccharide deacetylase family protein [Betaproteobacteria bacterium]